MFLVLIGALVALTSAQDGAHFQGPAGAPIVRSFEQTSSPEPTPLSAPFTVLQRAPRRGRSALFRLAARPAALRFRPQTIELGSFLCLGFRPLPMVQLRLNDEISLDGYASAAYDHGRRQLDKRLLLGSTLHW